MEKEKEEAEIRPWVKNLFKNKPQKAFPRKYLFQNRKIQYQALILQLDKIRKSTPPQN